MKIILYTVAHYENIFPSDVEANELKTYNGKQCYVKKNDDGSYELVQLLSTNPNDFLREEFRPGSIIKMS